MTLLKSIMMICVIWLITGCNSKQTPSDQKINDAAAEKKVFSTVLVGMSREEVIQKMGKPTFEDRGSEGLMIMYYFEKSPPYPVEKDFGYGGFEVVLTNDNKVSRVTIIHQSVHRSQLAASLEESVNRKRYKFTITEKMLEGVPNWEQGQECPPLSALRAKLLASEKLKELLPDAAHFEVNSISLHRIPALNKWYYEVKFEFIRPISDEDLSRKGIDERSIPTFEILVLLNGSVVEPVIDNYNPAIPPFK